MKIAAIGRTQLLYETITCLANAGHNIACVITAPAAPEYTRNEEDFRELARVLGAPFILGPNLDTAEIRSACAGLDAAVSVNWVSVMRRPLLGLFRLGVLNSHHGDLPKYRGNACSNWAIINGESSITNSIHIMEPDVLDCGRIVCQERLELHADSTITDVYSWAEETTPRMFLRAIDLLERDRNFTLKYADPADTASFRCYPRLPEDSLIDWKQTVTKINRLVRAVCAPFPGAYTYIWETGRLRKLRILESRIVSESTNDFASCGHVLKNDVESGESWVRCGEGVLALKKCRYEDEDDSFRPGVRWKSIRMRLGVSPEDILWHLSQK